VPPPNQPGMRHVRSAALRRLRGWRARQQAKLYQSLVRRQRVGLAISIDAPVVLIPEARTTKGQLLVVDLGNLTIGRDEQPGAALGPDEDAWSLRMTNMQVRHPLARPWTLEQFLLCHWARAPQAPEPQGGE
jgi:hypothetical protein